MMGQGENSTIWMRFYAETKKMNNVVLRHAVYIYNNQYIYAIPRNDKY
jgi:hypothetical protein